MESAITSLIVFGVMILAIFGLSERSLSAQRQMSESTQSMEERMQTRARTQLTSLRGATDPTAGNWVDITMQNSGSTKLAQFDRWDVILQYTDSSAVARVEWTPYTTRWTKQIYVLAPSVPEVFEPELLNPGEQTVFHILPTFSVGANTTNRATIAAPNGISASTVFTR